MKKIILSTLISALAITASAQSAYDAGNAIQSDLNGTARYVGMGGALNALGADISLMSANPAGTALYRKSDISFTASDLISDEKGQLGHDRSRMSFDQAGVLFAFQLDNSGRGLQYVNFGVNYRKNRNHFGNDFVNVQNLDNTFSQTFQIADLANASANYGYWGLLADIATPTDVDAQNAHDGIVGEDEQGYYGIAAQDANYRRYSYGSNIEADINISFNSSDRFYYGLSVGIYDFDYNRESFYEELGVDQHYYDFSNWYKTSGTGVDIKFGFIFRPIEDSPFRLGVNITTPTWYNLTDANGATLYLDDEYVASGNSGDYDYKFRTPWKFNLSLGHTFGTNLAIGAEYEFSDYASSRYTAIDYADDQYFREINETIKNTLKGQHTLKLGLEYKPVEPFSIRLGYNYVSSAYDKKGYKTILYTEPFTDTDFTNWGAINRVTFGLGYRWRSGYIDMAYQYQAQKGDFYAFDDVDLVPTEIKNNRSQILATLGFRF